MKLDPAKVINARGPRSQREIATGMRRLGLPGTQGSWISMVERGLIEPAERHATALAAVLGVGLSELLPAGHATALATYRIADDLAQIQASLEDIALTLGGRALVRHDTVVRDLRQARGRGEGSAG